MSPYILFAQTYYATSDSSSSTVSDSSSNAFYNLFQGLVPGLLFVIIIGSIFLVITIVYLIRCWMVQTAVFEMRDNLRIIESQTVKDTIDAKKLEENNNSDEIQDSITNVTPDSKD